MTCREKLAIEHPDCIGDIYDGGCEGCPSSYGYLDSPEDCRGGFGNNCTRCWDREIPEVTNIDTEHPCTNCNVGWGSISTTGTKSCHDTCERLAAYTKRKLTYKHTSTPIAKVVDVNISDGGCEVKMEPIIKDSGNRREFSSGAVRDMQEGKGRCDLMPLRVVSRFVGDDYVDPVLECIAAFQRNGETKYLYDALGYFDEKHWDNCYTMCLEVAKHFEEGAKKYGENNWQKGIPANCYIDSAVRHYLKWCRGDTDEPHDRAFVWNLMCCIWEVDYREKKDD